MRLLALEFLKVEVESQPVKGGIVILLACGLFSRAAFGSDHANSSLDRDIQPARH